MDIIFKLSLPKEVCSKIFIFACKSLHNQLGSVALGGTGATVNEFSTDGTFAANSDSIVPTQKAIKTYITSQIGGGASTLNVNQLTAGLVQISGQEITTTTVVPINVNATMNFKGGVDGTPVALNMFLMG